MKSNSLIFPTVIEYGRVGGNDVDRMVIVGAGEKPKPYAPSWPEDIGEESIDDFLYMLDSLHPSVTEPILTGRVIAGDVAWIASLQKKLIGTIIPVQTIDHLKTWSLWSLHSSRKFVTAYLQSRDVATLVMGLGDLSYALSCALFAVYYSKNPTGAVQLETVLEAFPDHSIQFNQVRSLFKRAQRALFAGEEVPSDESIAQLFQETREVVRQLLQKGVIPC